jgi:hypothetical protein
VAELVNENQHGQNDDEREDAEENCQSDSLARVTMSSASRRAQASL